MAKKINVVCLGGGIGTANLIKGLKNYYKNITVVVSMADSGGSAGRLRRLYKVHPVGDIVSCMAALSNNTVLSDLLSYRFPGERFSNRDSQLSGHKLGNLLLVGAIKSSGNFKKAIRSIQHVFNINGTFLPATKDKVTISAKTVEGKRIFGETKITRGKYQGKKVIDKIFLRPKNAKVSLEVIKNINDADVIVAGPGDLYTNLLPVLIVPGIGTAIDKSKAKKIYISNVANKPFETKNYVIDDYVNSIIKHIGSFPFNIIIANKNLGIEIPKKYNYKLLTPKLKIYKEIKLVKADVVNKRFPLYHDSLKLAKAVTKSI